MHKDTKSQIDHLSANSNITWSAWPTNTSEVGVRSDRRQVIGVIVWKDKQWHGATTTSDGVGWQGLQPSELERYQRYFMLGLREVSAVDFGDVEKGSTDSAEFALFHRGFAQILSYKEVERRDQGEAEVFCTKRRKSHLSMKD